MPITQTEHRFPCAQCGASLRFMPGQARLSCEYCEHEQPIPQIDDAARVTALQSLDYHEAVAQALPASELEETRVVHCNTCGADVQFEPNVHSAECPFCASPVVTDTGTNRHIKPHAILPFKLSEADAQAKMKSWLKGLWFAPSALAKYARSTGRLNGLYVPYWAFDVATRSQYTGQRGTYYYVTVRGANGKTRRERRTRWSSASGRVSRQFLDLLVMASNALPRANTRRLEPWTLADLQLYSADYLSGFRAEAYSVALPDGFEIAKERMAEQIRADIRRDIGGDEQRISSVSTDYNDERFKHLLLPIWMAAYRYRDKSYRFIVNGQTGRVQGERPWSWPKIAGAVLAGLVILVIAFYIAELGGM
ncbi:primosomal protein N' (replication factor Y) - superfamily II helicase [Roseinatronobacter alkalisoli]|uniref:Primosomal protein N' (Replication factor Y) -superfamily II helicase n=1 Tax=Roseinatronobacter alkalisoli TaxID=3028235 RepID=A0ABT5T5I9_9RHOB|nr:primosomal protein N' (replication factor Y) - superfamily II helicase [Roseinatronobacter sp. HJB301]MDD7970378.1 primosomal protein N' (replication factor Y) - superfamily II helicase [Roseinatronobacter sp. HJB301]